MTQLTLCSCYFSTMDLVSGFWQVELDPESREKSAFSTGDSLYTNGI